MKHIFHTQIDFILQHLSNCIAVIKYHLITGKNWMQFRTELSRNEQIKKLVQTHKKSISFITMKIFMLEEEDALGKNI